MQYDSIQESHRTSVLDVAALITTRKSVAHLQAITCQGFMMAKWLALL